MINEIGRLAFVAAAAFVIVRCGESALARTRAGDYVLSISSLGEPICTERLRRAIDGAREIFEEARKRDISAEKCVRDPGSAGTFTCFARGLGADGTYRTMAMAPTTCLDDDFGLILVEVSGHFMAKK